MEANSVVYKARPKRRNYRDTGQEALKKGRAERRQKLLVDRRRIPLNEVQHGPNMESVDEKPAGSETAPRISLGPVKRQQMEESKKRAATKRLEQLREWKKERDVVRRRTKEKSKKPFIPAGLNYSSIARLNTTTALPTSSQSSSVSRKSESVVAISSGLSLRNRTVKPPVPEKPQRLKHGMGSADSEKDPSRKPRPPMVTKPARLKSAGGSNNNSSSSSSSGMNKSVLCNGSVKGVGTGFRVGGKPTMGRNTTKRSSPPSSRTVAKVGTAFKASKSQADDSKCSSASEKDSGRHVSMATPPEVMERSPKRTPTSRPPLAPKPSVEIIGKKVITVNDPAWIPGQKFATPAPTDPRVFERTFGQNQLFSPYVFTGGKKKNPALPELPGFTFRLESVDSPDFSMREGGDDVADISTTSVTAIANDSAASVDSVGILNISDSSQEKVNATISHNNEVANRLVAAVENAAGDANANPESPASEKMNLESPSKSRSKDPSWSLVATTSAANGGGSMSSHPSSASKTNVNPKPDLIQASGDLSLSRSQGDGPTVASVQKNETESTAKASGFAFFRNLHDEVCRRWQVECDKWNEISTELESQKLASEEALDQIRTTVCQSQLLMRSKLKQYLGLVTQAEERTGEKIPSAEDLQGFWDLVCLQVEDLDKKFTALDELKANSWQLPKVSKPTASKPRRSKRLAAATSPQSSNPQAVSDRLKQQRAKRAAARSKFLQMKAAAATRRNSVGDQDEARRTSVSDQDGEKESTSVKEEAAVTGSGTSSLQMQKANHFAIQTMENNTTTASDCPEEVDGAFVMKYVSIKPTRKLQEMLGTDCILSPARRSLRIHRKSVGQSLASDSTSNNSIVVTSLNDLPHNLDYVIHPNPSLQ